MKKLMIALTIMASWGLLIISPANGANGEWGGDLGRGKLIFPDPPFSPAHMFYLHCQGNADGQIAKFSITAHDDNPATPDIPHVPRLVEEGGAFVFANAISIRQVIRGRVSRCMWRVMQKESDILHTNWSITSRSAGALLGAFDKPYGFRIQFDYDVAACRGKTMVIDIDGKPISRRNGQPRRFSPGSSYRGRGKTVSVRMLGNCPSGITYTGSVLFTWEPE